MAVNGSAAFLNGPGGYSGIGGGGFGSAQGTRASTTDEQAAQDADFRPYFNGQNWVTTPPQLTPEERSIQEHNQDRLDQQRQTNQSRFTSGVGSAVGDYLNVLEQQRRFTTDATAAGFTAQGYRTEVDQYTNAERSAESDANVAAAAGQIQTYQDMRKYQSTAGSTAAHIAGAGFKNSGSAVWLAQSAFKQAHITAALDTVNGQEKQVGYLETAAAARSQASAAGVASTAAEALATADRAAAGNAGATSSAISNTLSQYLGSADPNSVTPEARLSMAALSSSPDANLTSTVNTLNAGVQQPGQNWYTAAANGQASPTGLPQAGGTAAPIPSGSPLNRLPNLAWGIH